VTKAQIAATLDEIAGKYPPDMVAGQRRDIPRIVFHLSAALAAGPKKALHDLSICDLGGGIGLFSIGCAALGFGRVVLVDDFGDQVNQNVGDGVLSLHKDYGVEVVSCDVVGSGMGGLPGEWDVVTSFDSMEHWHRSPKALFREVASRLVPDGGFLLGVPNNVNLRKRISVPLGYGQWSSMQDWYEPDQFRGHVREPNVADLRYIAADMGLHNVKVFGRNWLGCGSSNSAIRWATRLIDVPLRSLPSLCSDIYMLGKKAPAE
jgi:SAM-dependent methyltransferase